MNTQTYRYIGYGRRVITNEDFASVGVDAEGLDVGHGELVDLTDETFAWLRANREQFVLVDDPRELDPDAPEAEPGEEDGENVVIEAPAGEEPGTSVDTSSPDVKSKPGK